MAYRLANPFSLALLAVAGGSVVLAIAAARHRSRRLGRPLALFLLGAAVWAAGDALRIAAPDRAAVMLWNDVAYLGVVAILPGYLLFLAAYAGRERWFRRRYLAGLAAASTAAYLVVLTNDLHGLWLASATVSPGTAPPVLDETWGPVWYLWAAYSYGLVLLGGYYAVDTVRRDYRSGTTPVQSGLVLVGILVPMVTNALFILEVIPFDPVTLAFGITGVAFSVAMLRYRLLGVGTVARDVVVGNLDSGVLVVDPADVVVDANRPACDILDRDRDALLGTPLATLVADIDADLGWVADARDDRRTVAVDTDEGVGHFDVDIAPLDDAAGTPRGRAIVFTDVTEAVEREATLRERTAELRRQNERLEEFASVVSHDLRNPLTVANGFLHRAREEGDEAAFDRVEDALDRMDAIVDDLLTLARAGAAIADADRAPVDVGDVGRAAWAHVDLPDASLDVAADTPTVSADRDRLLNVFENLYRNAAEHNDAPVTITVGPLPDGHGFFVADDGTGIPASERDTVFEHGYTTSDDGTGFGLSIVADVVEAHGWDVTLTESGAGGARFEIRVD